MSSPKKTHSGVLKLGALALSLAALSSCGLFGVNDCDSAVGFNENDTARLRTSRDRIRIAEPAAAAARVLPYALMSEYAYFMADGCTDDNAVRVDKDREQALRAAIAATTPAPAWEPVPAAGMQEKQPPNRQGCEDALGFMYHVWARTEGDQTYVVMAFRGTSGASDWMSGNLWWFTRWFRDDDQYSRAAAHAREVVAYFDAQAAAAGRNKPIFMTTGHSLGGGLAQHVLYALPQRVRQAIVFDPTAVTGSAGVSAEDFDAACNCAELYPETRFLRVYENYEILSVLRIFHKTFLGPERHVQELRFSFEGAWNPVGRHGMNFFASHLQSLAARQPVAPSGQHWIRSENQRCTDGLLLGQRASCALPSQSGTLIHRCPR